MFERLSGLLVGAVLGAAILTLGAFPIVGPDEAVDCLKSFAANTGCAETVFAGLVPYDEVLNAEKHRGRNHRCVTVVVQLSEGARAEPPGRTGRAWETNFGGDWKMGPSPWFAPDYEPVGGGLPDSSDTMMACARENVGEALYQRVRAAARDPETWRTEVGGAQLYSKKHGVAAMVHLQPL